MTTTRARLFGALSILLGLGAFCLGASAQMGFLPETTDHATTPSAPPAAEARAPPAALQVRASVGALSVERDLTLPAAAPVPAKLDRDVAQPNVPVPVTAGVGLRNAVADAPPAAAPAPAQHVASVSQRAVLALPEEAVLVGAAVATTAGLVAYFWGALKSLAARALVAPAVALYAKVTRAEVFDNAVRERIFAAIREHPGRSASDLAKLAQVSWGTTIYHLEVLEQNRMVTSHRQGRHRRYFENGAVLPASKETVSILQNAVTALVAERVRAQPGMTQKDLAAALAMSPQALHWHLARLQSVGVVQKQREGRVVRHFALGGGSGGNPCRVPPSASVDV